MQQVVLQFWTSIDGYSCDEGTELYERLGDISDPEHEEYFVDRLVSAGTHVTGRLTYEGMADYWPTSSEPIAAALNAAPKVVFSTTLDVAEWTGTRIARGDTTREIARLRESSGGEILVHGGLSFARSLIALGLVEEYRLFVLPFAVGGGSPLFGGLASPLALRITACTTFPSGIHELVYRPINEPADLDEPVEGGT
jgi:dihydrofolate reductase